MLALTHLAGFGVAQSQVGGAAAWSPTLKNSNITLSNSDRTATSAAVSGDKAVLGGTPRSSGAGGKWYAEVTLTTIGNNDSFGFASASAGLNVIPGFGDSHGYSLLRGAQAIYWNTASGSFATNVPTFASGDIGGLAYDATSGSMWWSKNGVWVNSSNPATGSGAQAGVAGPGLYICAALTSSNAKVVTINTGQSAFAFSVPSGFAAWG